MGSVSHFVILKGFQVRMMKECWAIENIYLISFTWMWGDDLVQIMVYIPFFIWKFVYQNISWYSPHIFTTLPTSGFSISFYNFKRIPSKDHEGMLSIWEVLFNFIYMNVRWWSCADNGVCSLFHLEMCLPKYLLVLPTYFNNTPHHWVHYFIL